MTKAGRAGQERVISKRVAKGKVVAIAPRQTGPVSRPRAGAMASSLLAAIVEAERDGGFNVRLTSGERVHAALEGPCSSALVRECMRAGRPVIAVATGDGYAILGAIQTESAAASAKDQALAFTAPEIRLDAARSVKIRAGRSAIELTADGKLRIVGERLTLDLAALVRFLSAKVELP